MGRAWVLGLLVAVAPAAAQSAASPVPVVPARAAAVAPVGPWGVGPTVGRPSLSVAPDTGRSSFRRTLTTPAGSFAASLVLPGAGQAALGLRRWIVYGLLEAGLWGLHLDARADVRSLSARYRELAWEEARGAGPLPRRDGDWDYYEHMSQYLASGAYDADPETVGLQPEPDEATYNGSIWGLAVALYLPSGIPDPDTPEFDRALAYYREHAVGPAYLWSWAGKEEELARFRGLIRETDDEARLRSTALGLLLANHVVSAIDAFLVARGRSDGIRLESRITPDGSTLRWSLGLRIPLDT